MQDPTALPRRSLLRSAVTLTAGCLFSPPSLLPAKAPAQKSSPNDRSPIIVASDSAAVAETACGKVRGHVRNGISTFKGIPYGGPTYGSGRFQPPSKPVMVWSA